MGFGDFIEKVGIIIICLVLLPGILSVVYIEKIENMTLRITVAAIVMVILWSSIFVLNWLPIPSAIIMTFYFMYRILEALASVC